MGGDGGCHPNGRQFMQGTMTKSKEEKEAQANALTAREQILIRTRTCALTNVALDVGVPVVADEIGHLFSKEALLAVLVEKTVPPEFSHIRGLRDVVECRFFPNPIPAPVGNDIDWSQDTWSPYSCPIANVEMNGRYPFVVLRAARGVAGGGPDERVNVISEKAVKEVGLDALQAEYGPFAAEDMVRLVPGEAEREVAIGAMAARRKAERQAKELAKASRKAEKKGSKRGTEVGGGGGGAGKGSGPAGSEADENGDGDGREWEKPKKAKSTGPAAGAASSGSAKGGSVGDAAVGRAVGQVQDEVRKQQKSLASAQPLYAAMFHGAGSQKPGTAQEQFIIHAGKRGLLN